MGTTTIGFTGFTGGKLGTLTDIHIHVPSNIIEQVEDIHLMLEHLVTNVLRQLQMKVEVNLSPAQVEAAKQNIAFKNLDEFVQRFLTTVDAR